MARKFLYGVATLVVLLLAALLALRVFSADLSRFAFVPRGGFAAQPALARAAYADRALWIARPGLGGDPAHWLPAGAKPAARADAAVFFVHPTSYLARDHWNAPLEDSRSRDDAAVTVRGMASPFAAAAELWAPRYRQATFGAFLSDAPDAARALELAYGDVRAAFDWFVAHADPHRPIVLVGHSQGALHLIRLLRERVAGTPLARRIAAAYVIGWPVSRAHDLPAIGLPACARAGEPGCVMSWESFAEPADPPKLAVRGPALVALDGAARLGAPPLCTNPLSGGGAPAAPASANLGTLVPDADLNGGKLVAAMVPARCDARGLLLIGEPPDLGRFVLPGNNYHLYDIPLFWANLRADFAARVAGWHAAHG